jgi:CO/xanthine dehydrogenase Mo-binding subunit
MDSIQNPIQRFDAREKISGRAGYIADLSFDDMLYARTLYSTRPRAVIRSIEVPDLPAGYNVIDRNDAPGSNRVHMIEDDWPFFAEERVNYAGEPILLVVGPDKNEIRRILAGIVVEYEEMEPALSIEDSLAMQDRPVYGERNIIAEYVIEKGDPAVAFGRAARVFENEYRTGAQEQLYMETQGVAAVYADGRITVYGSMQCPYYVKGALEQAFGWDPGRIRVVQAVTGGGFGGKEDYPSVLAGQAAIAAYRTGRPVQLILDRDEDVCCTPKRHPSLIRYKSALDSAGNITAVQAQITLDGGAYAGLSSVVLQRAMLMAAGVYNIPNARISGRVVATNNIPSGAFRGFGAPQALFAVEMHMQSVAERLGEDPLDFKMRHALRKGDRTVSGGTVHHEVKLPEMVKLLEDMSRYRERRSAPHVSADTKLRAIGTSLFFHGCAFTGSGEADKIKALVKLRKDGDGRVQILVSNVEMGQGPQTTLRKIVARTLGLPVENIIYDNPDTDRVPDSGPTVASRTVMIVGGLLEGAARDLKPRLEEPGEVEVERRFRQPGHIRWDPVKMRGDAYPTYSWGANAVEVEIDPVTFEIRVTGVWAVYDIGTPIDEKVVQGQVEGGIAQGLGYATLEVMETGDGRPLQANLTDYIIPTSMDFPRVEMKLVKSRYDEGPFGAKCLGELPLLGAAPALASAVQHALHRPVARLPVTPEYLMEAVEH